MSSFTEYHKKWKEENGRGEDNPYKQRSLSEIQESTQQYLDSMYGSQGKIWEKIQNRANINLNQSNNMQKVIDANTRNQMARNMEDYVSTKRTAVQNVSNYVQEKAKKEESKKKKNDKALLFDNTNKSKKDITLNARNQKEEIEQQIAQENKNSNNSILEQVYKQKNNAQEDKGLYSIDKRINMYEKKLPINKQDLENKSGNNDIIQDLEDISGIAGLGTKTSTLEKVSNFAKGIQDSVGLVKEVGLGVSSGGKQVLNYLETTTENANPNYKRFKEMQFLTSPNVSNEDKMAYKMGEKVETNLVKKAIRDSIAKDEQNIQEIQSNLNYKVSQKLGEIAPSMGQMLPGMALNVVNPVLGTSYFMTSAGGGYINDALNRGMTEEQALKYGTIMGVIEGASESFITGQQLNKISNAFVGKQIGKKVLDSYGFNIFENAVQEAVMEPAQEITAGIVGNKADWSNMKERMLESGFNGALMGAITNGVTYGLEKSGVVYNKIKNNEQVTIEEYREALQENIDRFGKEIVEKSIRQGAVETYQEINNVINLQQKPIQNQNNLQTQQITNQENKTAQNGNIEQIDNNLANNQQTVYNNTESEGGINGQSQFTNKQEISKQFEQSNEQKQINQRESILENGYKQNEQRGVERLFSTDRRGTTNDGRYERNLEGQQEIDYIKNPENHIKELNETQKRIKNRYEKIGIPVNFYSLKSKNAGKYDNGNLYVNIKDMSDIEQSNVATHEYAHHLIRNNKNFQNEISLITDKIIESENSGNTEAIRNYIMQRNENINVENLDVVQELALEEILADYMIDIDNEVDFKKNNQYEIDIEILNEYADIAKKYLPENIQTDTNNLLNEVETKTQSLGYKPDTEGKQRKHYKSVMESDQVGEVGKQSAKSLLENDTYKPLSNIDTLATANENINRNGVDNTYITFRSKLNSNERITLQDIATGERLIQIFSQNGDIEKVNGLIQDVAILGTELGQQVQAMSLIKKMSPEGQLMYLNKIVERTNIKENTDLKVTNEMSKKILEAKNQTELENVMTDIAIELGEQLPITMGDKVRAWRYLSMLGNPKTHIKNVGANVAMNITQQAKNKVAGAMEDVVGMFNKDMERTKTLRPANKDQRSFAKQDAEYMKDKIDGGGKYDIKNIIQNSKRQFDNKVLNSIAEFNSDMLELEDNIFLKKAYQQALQNYMSANKLSSADMQNSTTLQKAREYASYQAQEATFHQFSALAKRLTEIENKGGIAGKTLEAVIPFKKTPINIAKSGIEYSPIGLAKSITYDVVQLNKKTKDYKAKLEKGIISQAEYNTGVSQLTTKTIDNMAKGLTGTSLAILGYALTDMGILKAGNNGDDDEFEEKLGNQEYAIRIGDSTYTLDWVSPSAIPMFVGSTVYDLMHSEEDNSNVLNTLMTASAKTFEPMTDMSMLQGITSAISSYEQGSSNMLFDVGASAVSSYMGQFVPTALGQVAKIIDDKERDTSSTEKGLAKKVDQFTKQQIAKIPIASKILPVRKDVWGNDKTRDSNVLVRAYEVALAPYNKKKIVEDYTNKELLTVFENTGEMVLPGIPNKDITINKQKYRLTSEEYNKAKESFGKTSKNMLDNLVKTSEYKKLSDEQKAEAINNVYSYAKEQIKVNYAKSKKQEIETTSSYNILKELRSPSNQSEYLSYSAKIQGIEKDKEKKQILANSNYSSTTKATIYKNSLGKEDELYNKVLANDNININEYLNYKLQEFESDKEDDGTEQGKTIKGSKPQKVFEYVNNMNITEEQKIAILGIQYKLNYKEEKMVLFNYIDKIPTNTKEEKLEIFRKYNKNFVIYKDGSMDLK